MCLFGYDFFLAIFADICLCSVSLSPVSWLCMARPGDLATDRLLNHLSTGNLQIIESCVIRSRNSPRHRTLHSVRTLTPAFTGWKQTCIVDRFQFIENYHSTNTVFLVIMLMSCVGGVFILFALVALCYRSVVVHKNFTLCLRLVSRPKGRPLRFTIFPRLFTLFCIV